MESALSLPKFPSLWTWEALAIAICLSRPSDRLLGKLLSSAKRHEIDTSLLYLWLRWILCCSKAKLNTHFIRAAPRLIAGPCNVTPTQVYQLVWVSPGSYHWIWAPACECCCSKLKSVCVIKCYCVIVLKRREEVSCYNCVNMCSIDVFISYQLCLFRLSSGTAAVRFLLSGSDHILPPLAQLFNDRASRLQLPVSPVLLWVVQVCCWMWRGLLSLSFTIVTAGISV